MHCTLLPSWSSLYGQLRCIVQVIQQSISERIDDKSYRFCIFTERDPVPNYGRLPTTCGASFTNISVTSIKDPIDYRSEETIAYEPLSISPSNSALISHTMTEKGKPTRPGTCYRSRSGPRKLAGARLASVANPVRQLRTTDYRWDSVSERCGLDAPLPVMRPSQQVSFDPSTVQIKLFSVGHLDYSCG